MLLYNSLEKKRSTVGKNKETHFYASCLPIYLIVKPLKLERDYLVIF